jgi:hypothetical protein
MSGYRAGGSAGRLVTKSAASGSTLLPSIAALATVTTDSGNLSYGSWAQVVASSAAEYVITGGGNRNLDIALLVTPYVNIEGN